MTKVFHRAIGLLIPAFLALLPACAEGQCTQSAPPNPKAVVVDRAVQGKALEAARRAETRPAAPAAMIYQPRYILVPDLTHKTIEEVRTEVQNLLTIGSIDHPNPGWIVERQFPAPHSQAALCSPLDLWTVAPAPKMTIVPKIVGIPENRIAAFLEEHNLKYAGSTPKETNQPAGSIFDQDPEPGTREPWGHEVVAYRAVSPPPAVEKPTLDLDAYPSNIKPGEDVRFIATLKPYTPDAQFVFDFDDGHSAGPGGPDVTHPFDADRDYLVRVTAKFGNQQLESQRRITVHPIAYTLAVTWTPLHPTRGQPVAFTATLEPANTAIARGPYYFSFGGNTKPIQSSNTYSQSFAEPGTYPVHVMLRGEHRHLIESYRTELVVIELPPPPHHWGRILALTGAVLLIGSLIGLSFLRGYVSGLIGVRASQRTGSVDFAGNGLEAAFGFRLVRPPTDADAKFPGAVVLKVERVR